MNKKIWTIGHSTRSTDEFILLLKKYEIKNLADIRSYPGSRRYPHFNRENLKSSLYKSGINYFHIKELGGRRRARPDSKNTAWRNESFRGFADYMETEDFKKGIEKLLEISGNGLTAIMCSEALWWRCHRSLISDYLKFRNRQVIHIIDENKTEEHLYTQPVKIKQGNLFYDE